MRSISEKYGRASCLNCEFTEDKDVVSGGQQLVDYRHCRRNPPTTNGWPTVRTWDWCGEHKFHEEERDAQ